MRLIDADEAKSFAEECWPSDAIRLPIDAFLNRCATVDAEPVRHGPWETKEYTTEDSFDDWIVIHHEEVCSECEKGQRERSNFCPSCGAKMDKGGQNVAN